MKIKSLLFSFLSINLLVQTGYGNDNNGGEQAPHEVVTTVAFSITTNTTGKPATISINAEVVATATDMSDINLSRLLIRSKL